jgi:hypothetical protein
VPACPADHLSGHGEIGLNQPAGKADGFGLDANRVLMIWDERQDRRLLEDYKALIRGRRR